LALAVDQFEAGERVTVSAVSKGKGFAGTIKRWNFHRGPMTHGSKNKRRPGSIGSMYPQKVWKGKHMAGRLGHAKVTLRKVLISEIDKDNNLVAVKGAVPGARGGTVLLEAK
jgi:large subunit ribosomal protein L3